MFFLLSFLSIIRDIKAGKTLDYYTVDKFFKNLYDRKKSVSYTHLGGQLQ